MFERKIVFDNVVLLLECFGYLKVEIKKRVLELLEVVGIFEKKNDKFRNLSGG